MKLNKSIIYTGKYRGIPFEIRNWGDLDGKNPSQLGEKYDIHWNYYVFLNKEQLPEEVKFELEYKQEGKHFYSQYYNTVFNNIEFHGGITYAENQKIGKTELIKLGCDYGHLHDDARYETVESVYSDVINTIESLYEIIPNIKIFCSGAGGYFEEKNGKYTVKYDKEGDFYSNSYIEKNERCKNFIFCLWNQKFSLKNRNWK